MIGERGGLVRPLSFAGRIRKVTDMRTGFVTYLWPGSGLPWRYTVDEGCNPWRWGANVQQ